MTAKRLTPIQSIKAYCKESCCAGDTISWKTCSFVKCPLYPYRLGKRPTTKPFQEYTKKQVDLPNNSLKNDKPQENTGGENARD